MKLDPVYIIPDDRKNFNLLKRKPNQKSATSLERNCRDWRKWVLIWVISLDLKHKIKG